jgi:hypothetical protein
MPATRVLMFTLLALVGFITMSVSAMGIEVRDNAIIPRTEAFGPPSSSCDACGAGYIPCGPSDCFNPSAGEICCNPSKLTFVTIKTGFEVWFWTGG